MLGWNPIINAKEIQFNMETILGNVDIKRVKICTWNNRTMIRKIVVATNELLILLMWPKRRALSCLYLNHETNDMELSYTVMIIASVMF